MIKLFNFVVTKILLDEKTENNKLLAIHFVDTLVSSFGICYYSWYTDCIVFGSIER